MLHVSRFRCQLRTGRVEERCLTQIRDYPDPWLPTDLGLSRRQRLPTLVPSNSGMMPDEAIARNSSSLPMPAGSNGARLQLWKTELAKLADETVLDITVIHLPHGARQNESTSKWNRIEHRLYPAIAGTGADGSRTALQSPSIP